MEKKEVLDVEFSVFNKKEFGQIAKEFLNNDKADAMLLVTGDVFFRQMNHAVCRELCNSKDALMLPVTTAMFSKEELGNYKGKIISGMEILDEFLYKKRSEITSFYLVGDDENQMRKFMEGLEKINPELKAKGAYFLDASLSEEQKLSGELVINEINGTDADVVLVLMNSPEQETWICENYKLLHTKACLGIGMVARRFLKYHKRAPKILAVLGLEPLFHKIYCHEKMKESRERRIFSKKMEQYKKEKNSETV